MKRIVRSTALVLSLAVGSVTATGCIGKYALFNKVLDWNGTLGDKWINSVVHFAFWLVPIYPLTVVGDFLIFNTIEFWTGSNPIAANGVGVSEDGQAVSVRIATNEGDYVIEQRRGEPAHVYRDGALIGMGEPAGDGKAWIFYDLEGGETRVASADELAAAFPTR